MAASNLPVSISSRGGESGGGAVDQRRKGLAAPTTQLRKGARVASGKQRGPHKKAAGSATRSVVHRAISVVQRHLHKTERKTVARQPVICPSCARCAPHGIGLRLFDRLLPGPRPLWTNWQTARRLLRFTQLGETLKKLFAPTLEKALTFLDDKLLPSTSNAVERGNRRYRKMQKQVYRVRTQAQVSARLALDMWREAQGAGRHQTLHTLHEARAA